MQRRAVLQVREVIFLARAKNKNMKRFLATSALILLLASQFTHAVKGAPQGPLYYTALGDSLAYGILDLSRGGYVPRYAGYVQDDTGSSVVLNNLGQNGLRSDQLLEALRTNSTFRNSISNSQIVTWDIGGNDFLRLMDDYREGNCGGADNQDCLRSALTTFKVNWSAIIVEILSLRRTSDTVVRTMDIYNPFVKAQKTSDSWANDGGLNDFQVIKPYIDEANNHIRTTAAARGIPCAKVYQAFNGINGDEDAGDKGYISPYDFSGVHPGELGHKVIADLLRNLGYSPLSGSPTISLSSSTYGINEGAVNTSQGFGALSVTVTRSGDTSGTASVQYFTSDQSGGNECHQVTGNASQRCDYGLVNGTLRFAAGEGSKVITIPIISDGYLEGDETFILTLQNAIGTALGTSQATITIQDRGVATTAAQNPYLSNEFFVRQNYLDFLAREPDVEGWNTWPSVLNNCGAEKGFLGAPKACDRAFVSHGFIASPEFTTRGYLAYRMYEVALLRLPRYAEFVPDMAAMNGAPNSQELEQNTQQFAESFTARGEFTGRYGDVSAQALAAQLIARLEQNAAVVLPETTTTLPGQPTQYGRTELINKRLSGEFTVGQTLRAFVEQKAVYDRFFERGFVTMQYFGFLRRDPDLNDPHLSGWTEWVFVFTNGGAARNRPDILPRDYQHLTFGFIYSEEYRKRFGQP
jgi:lysophospholipase L1-like esterase